MIVAERIRPISMDSMVARLAAWHIPASSPLTISSLSVARYPKRSASGLGSPACTAVALNIPQRTKTPVTLIHWPCKLMPHPIHCHRGRQGREC